MSNLTDYKKYPKLIKFSSAVDPVIPVVGAKLRDTFINTTSGEIFTCVAIGLETWRGSLGTLVQNSLVPVVEYTMDNFSGSTLLDEGANSYDLVPVGGTPAVVAGISSNAVSLTTPQYYESSAVATNLQALTTGAMSYWFKITDGPYTMGPHLTDASGLNSVLLFYNTSSTPAFSFSSDSGAGGTAINAWKYISPPLGTTVWHHVVYQFTGSVMEFYLNGVLTPIDSGGSITTAGWFSNTTEAMKIRISNATQNGSIDAVKFFDRHLTPSEVSTLYTEFN